MYTPEALPNLSTLVRTSIHHQVGHLSLLLHLPDSSKVFLPACWTTVPLNSKPLLVILMNTSWARQKADEWALLIGEVEGFTDITGRNIAATKSKSVTWLRPDPREVLFLFGPYAQLVYCQLQSRREVISTKALPIPKFREPHQVIMRESQVLILVFVEEEIFVDLGNLFDHLIFSEEARSFEDDKGCRGVVERFGFAASIDGAGCL
jgi:hypothetical protein